MVKILIKKLNKNTNIPEYKTDGSSGMDLMANIEKPIILQPGEKKTNFHGYHNCNSK